MKPNRIMCIIPAGIVAGIFMFSSCHSGYSLASVEGSRIEVTAALDANPDSAAIAVLAPYQKTVDSIMSPVIGQSARFMDRFRPESELSNLVADILRYSASAYIGRMADVGVTNMGGLRTALPEGDITYGNIYEITPFENTLCIVTMNGVLLRELFENIAAVHGEGLSGACLEISGDGKLLDATVAGKEIEDSKEYKVATLDYLAEGNDHMTAFEHVLHTQGLVFIQNNRQMPDDICIEPATQTGIGGKHDDSHTLHFTFHNERRLHLTIRTQKIGQDVIQPSFVRKHVFYGSLRLMQLGRGYHLHSRSNFPRIIY